MVGFDPFFRFYRAGIPATQVLQAYDVNRPGFDVGAGLAFGSKFHGKFFAEVRWRRVLFENDHLRYDSRVIRVSLVEIGKNDRGRRLRL